MKNSLYLQLKTETTPISLKEIEEILDEELQKNVDEIDTELVELCLSLLTSPQNNPHVQNIISFSSGNHVNKPSVKLGKKLLLVATMITMLCTTLMSGAKGQSIKFYSGITDPPELDIPLRIYHTPEQSSFQKNMQDYQYPESSPLSQLLEQNDFTSTVLPDFLLGNDIVIEKYYFDHTDLCQSCEIHLGCKKQLIRLAIDHYSDPKIFTITDDFHYASQSAKVEKEGLTIDVIYHEDSNESILAYSYYSYVYRIGLLNCSFEDAIRFAENFK